MYTAISKKVVGKSARDNLERYCGWLWSWLFFKDIWKAMDVCLRVLKESNKRSFDSCSVRNSVLIISYVTFRDCRVHFFQTTFLEIAVFIISKWSPEFNPALSSILSLFCWAACGSVKKWVTSMSKILTKWWTDLPESVACPIPLQWKNRLLRAGGTWMIWFLMPFYI